VELNRRWPIGSSVWIGGQDQSTHRLPILCNPLANCVRYCMISNRIAIYAWILGILKIFRSIFEARRQRCHVNRQRPFRSDSFLDFWHRVLRVLSNGSLRISRADCHWLAAKRESSFVALTLTTARLWPRLRENHSAHVGESYERAISRPHSSVSRVSANGR